MSYGDDQDPANEIKKSLDRFEQRVNSKYDQVIDQLSTLARMVDMVNTRQNTLEQALRLRVADSLLTIRDISFINAELTQLQLILSMTNPEFKKVFDNARASLQQTQKASDVPPTTK